MNNINYKLYLVTDRKIIGERDFVWAIEQAILGGATLVQLREKDLSTLQFYNVAKDVKELTSKYNIPLIINDRLDIALAVDADGLHIGQDDMPLEIARKLLGEGKIIGLSTSTIEEAKLAQEQGADYIGVGAVFPTTTKNDADAVSLEQLKEIKETVKIPVVAIGGINEENYKLPMNCGIDGVAVISAILGKSNIKAAAEKFV
ncbi:thiamine-phosphate synthase [Clostridium polyendosporum]|uniref:Thiamine-phosphate synthase n=1 Tax=Clostridium polyendosporum TaxID=69208 RepID=A0A919S1R6_9CLOT|nr:thiamine phosphate synthase [Clostridium polyendosporum]GIM29605.1 thiamine-phosphate synthase [Clostridium polyendosporum]